MLQKLIPLLAFCSIGLALPSRCLCRESGAKGLPPAGKLPARILSGYNGFWINAEDLPSIVENMLDPMREAGFTAVDFKIQPSNFNLSDPAQLRRLKELARAVRERNLVLLTYVYPDPYTGIRDPQKDASLPAVVRADGTVVKNRFSLIHWPTWRKLFDNAFQLARVSRELGILAVQLDIETLQTAGVSYDDLAWRQFASLHHLRPDLPAIQRFPSLQREKLVAEYEQWYQIRLDEVAKRFEQEMHSINPDLALGIMPCHGALVESFIKHLATSRAPAIMDSWVMYNGQGYTKAVLEDQARIKNANPHNLFIPWFRINNYRPEDIAIQAYYAAKLTDGYSNWTMYMIYKDARNHRGLYGLPDRFGPEDYFHAYRRANQAVRSDLAQGIEGTGSIPFKPVTPLAPALKLEKMTVPELTPAGSGKGEPVWLALRNQQTVYVYAADKEPLDIDVIHLAGEKRMVSLHYLILDKNLKSMTENTVAPGEKRKIAFTPPQAGIYALVISGGEDGLAWYGVRVNNRHMAIPAQPGTDFFYINRPYHLYLTRTSATGPARVTVTTGGNQIFSAQINNVPPIVGQKAVFDLPPHQTIAVIIVDKPKPLPDGMYTQEFGVTTEGAISPYLSDGPERRLK